MLLEEKAAQASVGHAGDTLHPGKTSGLRPAVRVGEPSATPFLKYASIQPQARRTY